MIVIKTKRLLLETLGIKHLQTVHKYVSDYENTKYMTYFPNKTLEETIIFLRRIENEWMCDTPSFYEFAIIYKNQQIGAVGIYQSNDLSGELSWIINKKYWGQGIAYEAAKALLEYSITEFDIKHFIAYCDVENIASYKIMEKLGMFRTCTYRGRKNKNSSKERMGYQYELYI